MAEKKAQTKIRKILDDATVLIKEIQDIRKKKLLVFISETTININVCHLFTKVIRRTANDKSIDVLIESFGGEIDYTAKIVKLLKSYCGEFDVLIPCYAKSAATLLALNATKMILCKPAELGPVNPLVRDPATNLFFPAHSIGDALDFIEKTDDPIIKVSLTDKLNPLLIGAYRDVEHAGRQYLEETLQGLENSEKILEMLATKYRSHGYPIDRNQINELIPEKTIFPEKDLEKRLLDLHELYMDYILETKGEHLILQTEHISLVFTDGKEVISDMNDLSATDDVTESSKNPE